MQWQWNPQKRILDTVETLPILLNMNDSYEGGIGEIWLTVSRFVSCVLQILQMWTCPLFRMKFIT